MRPDTSLGNLEVCGPIDMDFDLYFLLKLRLLSDDEGLQSSTCIHARQSTECADQNSSSLMPC